MSVIIVFTVYVYMTYPGNVLYSLICENLIGNQSLSIHFSADACDVTTFKQSNDLEVFCSNFSTVVAI